MTKLDLRWVTKALAGDLSDLNSVEGNFCGTDRTANWQLNSVGVVIGGGQNFIGCEFRTVIT